VHQRQCDACEVANEMLLVASFFFEFCGFALFPWPTGYQCWQSRIIAAHCDQNLIRPINNQERDACDLS
jgi:hypothetical protein